MHCTLRAKRHLISTAILAGTFTAAMLLPTGTSFAATVDKHDSPSYIGSNSGDADDNNFSALTLQNSTGTAPTSSPTVVYLYSTNNGQYVFNPNTSEFFWLYTAGTAASQQYVSANANQYVSTNTDQYFSGNTDQYTAEDSASTAYSYDN